MRLPDGRLIKVADLVDDEPGKRDKVVGALKDPAHRQDRDHVDIIIALGMAKEGFDWIWCEHALTVGYRSSLTEIIQIIGRATRDAPGKTAASFTNLIAEPDASEEMVVDAVNDTLKAIAASLLMEQVLAPRFDFTPKNSGEREGFNYGEGGYNPAGTNVGFNEATGQFHLEINGLVTPQSNEAKRICQEDLNEVITAFVQDKSALERGLFDEETAPEELTQVRMGKIVKDRYPELGEADQEAVRHAASPTRMRGRFSAATPSRTIWKAAPFTSCAASRNIPTSPPTESSFTRSASPAARSKRASPMPPWMPPTCWPMSRSSRRTSFSI